MVRVLRLILLALVLPLSACSDDPFPFFYAADGSGGGDASGDAEGDSSDAADTTTDTTDTTTDADPDAADTGGDTGLDATDTRTDVAPECTDNSQCEGGEICNEFGVCVTFCAFDGDCSGDTPRCEVETGRCVECLSELHCSEGEACTRASECAFFCSEDWECGDGQVCTDNVCVDGGGLCEPGEARCAGSGIETCNFAGTGFDYEECEFGECVLSAGEPVCEGTACEPSSFGCVDTLVAWSCDEEGTYKEFDCDGGRVCRDGSCQFTGERCVEATPTTLNFGTVTGGSPNSDWITVTNCGTTTVTVARIEVTGTGFTLGESPSVPFTAPETEFEVRFSSATPGPKTGSAVVRFADGTSLTVSLRANVAGDVPGDLPSLRAELSWNTTADLDNHLRRGTAAWLSTPGDCHYANKTPDWGAAGVLNNPTLDRDDTDGFGPEIIDIAIVESGVRYTSGVFVTSVPSSTTATLRLFVGGALVDEISTVLTTTTDMWEVFSIQFRADGTYSLDVIDEVGGT